MIVIGLVPLQDSPVPTVSLLTTTTRNTLSDLPPPSGGFCAAPVTAEPSFMAPHRPADPHQFVCQRHRGLVVADGFGGLQRPDLQLRQPLWCRTLLLSLGRAKAQP